MIEEGRYYTIYSILGLLMYTIITQHLIENYEGELSDLTPPHLQDRQLKNAQERMKEKICGNQ